MTSSYVKMLSRSLEIRRKPFKLVGDGSQLSQKKKSSDPLHPGVRIQVPHRVTPFVKALSPVSTLGVSRRPQNLEIKWWPSSHIGRQKRRHDNRFGKISYKIPSLWLVPAGQLPLKPI